MSDLPKRVTINEEGPREGFQSEKKMIPVADKVRLIEALADTGLKHIACVSTSIRSACRRWPTPRKSRRKSTSNPACNTARCG